MQTLESPYRVREWTDHSSEPHRTVAATTYFSNVEAAKAYAKEAVKHYGDREGRYLKVTIDHFGKSVHDAEAKWILIDTLY